jgi:hypothetical protein
MADLRCPNCGKNNPDFLDVCQFCQTPLKPESMVHTGETPVKKNTGELEPILPQWLKDVRQQARESAKEEAEIEAAKPKVQNEAPDLLAGLASQTRNDDEQVPDWLASMNPITRPAPVQTSTPDPETDFFAQFKESAPASQTIEPVQEAQPSWMGAAESAQPAEEKDELSEWLMKASAEPGEAVNVESDTAGWRGETETPAFSFKEPASQPKDQEDLDWLHALEDSSKEPEKPARQPSAPMPVEPSQPSSQQEDLGWLKNLGTGSEAFALPDSALSFEQKPVETPSSGENLSWLDNLGGIETPASQESASGQPQNLDWLNNLGGQGVTPFKEKPDTGELDWLKKVEQSSGSDATPPIVSPFTRRTGPLGEEIPEGYMPDWLKSATEEPSMPAPGALSDWFRETSAPPSTPQPFDQRFDELSASTRGEPAPPRTNLPSSSSDSTSLSNQDVDSLFSAEMPDWLSRPEPGAAETPSQPGALPASDSLAPADLPSWVQSMRPVESVMAGASSRESQEAESEGPLAGLEGVIPVAPIGSSRRPKAVSLKLQASDEQQAGAALLEKILASETNPRSFVTQANIQAPRVLRWLLTSLFIIVLGGMAYSGTQSLPISPALPQEVVAASSTIARLPQNSLVLVVIDYEPALAAEMEAVSGPMLYQLVLTTHARLAFLSTSPNGTALVRRLLTNTGISVPAPSGLGYAADEDYVNLGYLPGGFSGVREFIESPNTALPQAKVASFTDYAAILVLTDHAESGRVWVEQLYARNQADTAFFSFQPLLVASSAQAGPMLQPYFSSEQIAGMVSGLADAARYEFINNSRPGLARRYWDSFGVGLLMATVSILLGSLWSLFSVIRARRVQEAG